MKRYRIIPLIIIIALTVACSNSGVVNNNGELVGTAGSGDWMEPYPSGMVYINNGALRIGASDEDPTAMIEPSRTVSIDAFYMDDTETTNNEYRQFTNWVRDSIARHLLYTNGSNANAQYYGRVNANGDYLGLDWAEVIDWTDTLSLDPLYVPIGDRFFGKREIDARVLFYDYAWINYKKAAAVSQTYDYQTGTYQGGIDRSAFIVRNKVNVYPDTLCWIRDFTYSFNDPMTEKYYYHPGYDNYPVVGVSWEQANAFCHWRTKLQNESLGRMRQASVMKYRLPTEWEWEWAARGGLQNSKYPWGGYYPRNSQGQFLANFKPVRGNYNLDGYTYTRPVNGTLAANDYGLYDMAGNVAEWTNDTYDELSVALLNDLNPYYQHNYDPAAGDQPALARKVIRGGSWKDISHFVQTSTRTYEYQDSTKSFIGFRCVRSSIVQRKP